MTQTATPAVQSGPIERHYFLLRRLHSLTGIVPIGVFVLEHLFTNSAILLPNGSEHYQTDVNFIWNMPGLLLLEVFGIWLPLLFHGLLGFLYVFTGRPNSATYKWSDNRRYTWMRITGVIALFYIFIHLAQTRWGWTFGGLYDAPFDPANATLSTAQSVQYAGWITVLFYLVGTLSVVFHFANGLWTSAITWGLTLSVQGQRRWGKICLVIGIILALASVGAIARFATIDIDAMKKDANPPREVQRNTLHNNHAYHMTSPNESPYNPSLAI